MSRVYKITVQAEGLGTFTLHTTQEAILKGMHGSMIRQKAADLLQLGSLSPQNAFPSSER